MMPWFMPFSAAILMEGETTFTVQQFITTVGTIFTTAIGWLVQVGTTIAGEPILLTFTALPLIGLGVGLYRRLLNIN